MFTCALKFNCNRNNFWTLGTCSCRAREVSREGEEKQTRRTKYLVILVDVAEALSPVIRCLLVTVTLANLTLLPENENPFTLPFNSFDVPSIQHLVQFNEYRYHSKGSFKSFVLVLPKDSSSFLFQSTFTVSFICSSQASFLSIRNLCGYNLEGLPSKKSCFLVYSTSRSV